MDQTSDLPTINGYDSLVRIGQGGMGVVYRARCTATGDEVAIKFVKPGEHERVLRFVRETRLVEQISHPHIVRMFDSGSVGDIHFFVMEYMVGGCLRDVMGPGARIDPTQALVYLQQIGSALGYLHERSIIHRDLKPENILLDETGCSKITDFGLSVRKDDVGTMTVTGQFLGTMDYIAPEQRYRLPLDERVDQFAFGVIAYELLVGKRPLGSFKAPSELIPQLNRQIDAAILRALEEDPDDRFSSVREFLTALESALCQTARGSLARSTLAGTIVLAMGIGVLCAWFAPPPASRSPVADSGSSTRRSSKASAASNFGDTAAATHVRQIDTSRSPETSMASAAPGVNALIFQADTAVLQGRYATAVVFLSQALERSPGVTRVLKTRSYCYWKQMKIELALRDLKQVVESDPGDHDSRARCGMMLFQQRQYKDALSVLDEGVRRNSEFALFYAYRGWVRYRLRNMDLAFEDLNRAIEIDRHCGEAYQYRALVHQRYRRYRETLSDLERSANCMPDNPFAHAFLASFLSTCRKKGLRDGKRALEIAHRACSLSGWGEFQSLRSLAAAHAELDELDEAIRWGEEAMKCAPPASREKLEQQVQYYRRRQMGLKSDVVVP